MDTSTVQEITNQLGIGVDQVLQYLPNYANTQILANYISIIVTALMFVICIIAGIVSFKLYKKHSQLGHYGLEEVFSTVCAISFSVAGIVFIIFAVISCNSISAIISWENAPELTFLKSLIPK